MWRFLLFLVLAAACADKATPTDAAAVDASGDAPFACPPASTLATAIRPLRILFFTKETLYHHYDAHDAGDTSVPIYLRARGHTVTVSDDPTLFTDASLAGFDVIVFFVTSGSFLSADQRTAFENFVHAGKGVVGVHTATATEQDNDFYRNLMGASFLGHGVGDAQVIPGSIIVVDPQNPLVSFLPNPWVRTEEWYYYTDNPANNPELKMLLELDESTIAAYYPDYPEAGFYGDAGHPLAWTHESECGRIFYTALGHTGASYSEEPFLHTIAAGIEWAGAPASEKP